MRYIRSSHTSGDARRRVFGIVAVAFTAASALSLPLSAEANPLRNGASASKAFRAHVPPTLRHAAKRRPNRTFSVIVQGSPGNRAVEVASDVEDIASERQRVVSTHLRSIDGVAADLTGAEILALSRTGGIAAITPDHPVRLSGSTSKQLWPYAVNVDDYWPGATKLSLRPPTIAIVDSGIDASRTDFSGRVLTQVEMVNTGDEDSAGDGRGHGTFVASIAAGSAAGYLGAAPNASLVSIDVADKKGMARTRDVIEAADWIVANKDKYGIRVVNFSLHSVAPATFMYDPLDKAVERLWFSGVVVVAAAGNYAVDGQASGVPYAPANDPFIITVGATDVYGTARTGDDFNAPWSAYGYTLDGFSSLS
ncbi:MAG: S8 family serine peptidase, partial [Actinomycetota bacterium]|nr:S8 family serine peptidase [Actinomycetota bacterium]